MPIFGYNAIGANNLGLGDTDLFGNWNLARLLIRGNPVAGGNLVSAHVYMTGPPGGGVNVTVQIGVYDASVGAPPLWPLFATSAPFNLPVAAPGQWWVTPIVGVLVAGNSYAAALVGNNGHASNGGVLNDPIPSEYTYQGFIVPGVFPNPLGVGNNATREWSLYITYSLNGDDDAPTSACCCMPNSNSNMNL